MKIEGKNAVREAILNGISIEKIMASNNSGDKAFNEIITLAKQRKIKLQFVDIQALNKASETKQHQGIVAYGAAYQYFGVEDILQHAKKLEQPPFILILDEIADPHNLGSIIRTAECMGVHGIIIPKDRSCLVNETVIKVSAGATSHVKIVKVTNINQEIEKLKKQNIFVYALELGGKDLAKTNLTGAIALVIGSEGKGVGKLTKSLCDEVVTIAQYGKLNSLNASVATGMALYEIKRQSNANSSKN